MDSKPLSVEPFGFSEEEYRQVARIEGAVFAMPPLDWEEFQHDDETRDPDGWQQRLFELEKAISLDIPSHGEKKDESFEIWSRRRLQGPMFDADGWFVALHGDRYVGESQGYISQTSPESFENGITGVLRDYRRRGIATALKVHLMRYAQQRGAHSVVTSNASQNPMFGLNLALGFRPEPAWIVGEKAL